MIYFINIINIINLTKRTGKKMTFLNKNNEKKKPKL